LRLTIAGLRDSAPVLHPHEDDACAQQVDPSIDACEAPGRQKQNQTHGQPDGYRNPNGWSAWWIWVSLRIVTLFGRVFFIGGRPGDAPGIHFGHWHIIEGVAAFVLLNYDGNFGGYLTISSMARRSGHVGLRWTTLMPRRSAASVSRMSRHRAASRRRDLPSSAV
jgi:hypothetical protein